MLPLSIGILSWRSNKSIRNTLKSYRASGLLNLSKDVKILFQEAREEDIRLAESFGLPYIALNENIGIGNAFTRLAEEGTEEHILLLEHDWELVEKSDFVQQHLKEAIGLLQQDVHCVRLRHRQHYGFPHYSIERYKGKELDYFDEWIQFSHPHLLDVMHWIDRPDLEWPDKFVARGNFYVTPSRYGNWTNNPCLYNREFYINAVKNFAGQGIDLEKNISYWWARQEFNVAQGQGLFKHNDIDKYEYEFLRRVWKKLRSFV